MASTSSLPPETIAFATKCFDLARSGDVDTLRVYIEAGLPPNLTNEKGRLWLSPFKIRLIPSAGNTLLMLAAYNGHADTVKMLAGKGADINALNNAGQSPLAGAIFKGEAGMVKTLVELRADPRVGHPTAVDSAKMFGQRQYMELLGATEEESRAPTPPMYRAPQTNGN
jgi:hypothetical protein